MRKILIVEDDTGISKSLKLYLENSDFEVKLHDTWEWAVEKIKKTNPDLLILDINLPKKDGITICQEVRETLSLPIIMLTARTNEIDRIKSLEIWADDYISKPFSPRELLARINSIIRRSEQKQETVVVAAKPENIYEYEDIILEYDKTKVTKGGVEVTFTKNEYDILKKIMQEEGKVVLRETLMKDIIGYDQYLFDRTIDTHIKNIRKKVGYKDMILTIRGKWYRLNS